jgi:murein DD-endopeptidase MepM/ murein hydrolase activator NlpD
MTRLEALSVVLQLVVPLSLIAWLAVGGRGSGRSAAMNVVVTSTYILATVVAAPWLALPWYLPRVFIVLLAVATVAMIVRRRAGAAESRRSHGWPGIAARGVPTVLLAGVAILAFAGRQPFDEAAVDLAFPLRDGAYLVANGGSRELVNPHLKTLQGSRFRHYRGQSYAVDLVKVGAWGSRRTGLSPNDPSGFAIFGDSVHAPCAGVVVRAVDGDPDRLPAGTEPRALEGNHVILACDGVWVLLAHLKMGSVQVGDGDVVSAGDVLGRVGNSGRSDEPHLHLHVQAPGTVEAPFAGDPLPVTFGGRHLVRNARIRGTG